MLRFGEQEFEASAYRASSYNTSKGLIREISKEESPEDIVTSLVTPCNPGVLHAKRMGDTDNVIALFEGFHVPSYVKYGAMLIRWSLYKKQIDICYGYGRTGHRADVCPNPEDDLPGVQRPPHGRQEVRGKIQDTVPGQKTSWKREEEYAKEEEYYYHNNKEARGSSNNNNHKTIASKYPSTDKEGTSRKTTGMTLGKTSPVTSQDCLGKPATDAHRSDSGQDQGRGQGPVRALLKGEMGAKHK
ncbi:hypothetical protein HPB49_007233 [Dermacentor silvarum]|uniref:Uncharacterized protein n=1 Tax=Dermacentor silvarum TaxID=543639 RepID=A0ACB8DX06_DERSI|nr:hypothetical protein HPB49_007233 [Dermacentor silvarum]